MYVAYSRPSSRPQKVIKSIFYLLFALFLFLTLYNNYIYILQQTHTHINLFMFTILFFTLFIWHLTHSLAYTSYVVVGLVQCPWLSFDIQLSCLARLFFSFLYSFAVYKRCLFELVFTAVAFSSSDCVALFSIINTFFILIFYCQFSGAPPCAICMTWHFPARFFVTTIPMAFVVLISQLCLYYMKRERWQSKKNRPLHLMCVFIGVGTVHDIQQSRLMTVNALSCATRVSFALTQFTII